MIGPPRLVAALAALAVVVTLGAAAPSRAAEPGPAGPSASEAAALATLARVQAIFDPAPGPARGAAPGPETDATLALRDLSLVLDDLPADQEGDARALFRRPTAAGGDGALDYDGANVVRQCSGIVCVHHATEGVHQPSDPAWADTVLATLRRVNATYLRAGYKRPLGDAGRGGGTNLVDTYIGDIDARGIYGYCAADDPTGGAPFGRSAYCVLDDDYVNIRTGNTDLEDMQVTAAHEYFHAVQYAYDYLEDSWFLEATATWMEDEMYDGVNDNRQYLRSSPLRAPRRSMDQFTGLWHYGVWIFFRYLSERFPASKAGLPTIVRDMMRRADGNRGARRDYYSWQAVDAVLRSRRTSAAAQFLAFSAANRTPGRTYAEGTALDYPAAPLWTSARLGGSRRSVSRAVVLDHLSSATARFAPRNLPASAWRLRLRLDLPPKARGSLARLSITPRRGAVRRLTVRLDRAGDATRAVAFSSRAVRHVELTLVNASARYDRCFTGTRFSCQGRPLDDNLRFAVTATAVR